MLSHLDQNNSPQMVNIEAKTNSQRRASAQSIVILPQELLALLEEGDVHTKKGPVFQTAKLAAIMAAKKTSDLIPLCHTILLEACDVRIDVDEKKQVVIECTVTTTGKTGVEMEALVGASTAALTIYDMCKALSHNIVIKETKLLEKTGGKNDFFQKR